MSVVEGSVTVRGCDMDDDGKERAVRKWRGGERSERSRVKWSGIGRKKEKRL